MRVQTEEWRRFIPGVRMYKGKKTLFWNGEKLWDNDNGDYLIYDYEESNSWEVVIVLPGVEVIPDWTFACCVKLETVIMADTVQRIESHVFDGCHSLMFVKFSRNLEYIGGEAFSWCSSLSSIFIPPACREIGREAFQCCTKLLIFHVPQRTQLGERVITDTALLEASSIEIDEYGEYEENTEEVNEWLKVINQGEEYELHRACSSFNPLIEIIYGILKRKGLASFTKKNELGLTPFDYLEANPFVENEIDQRALIKRYILEMMGETV